MAGAGMDARQLADYRRFLASLNDAIARQGDEVARSESGVTESRDALQERSLRRDTVDQLVERTRAALLKADERREQRLSDESSLQQHRQRDRT
jgi:flagellar FliJ protein